MLQIPITSAGNFSVTATSFECCNASIYICGSWRGFWNDTKSEC
jgi:hypothetical protein